MINELKAAIIADLGKLPGVTCEEYAGQLEDKPVGQIRAPAILIHFGEMKLSGAEGYGSEYEMQQQISAFCIAKHARHINERVQSVDTLVESVLPKVHNVGFMDGATLAKLDKVVPHYMLESQGASVREIRWNQSMIAGEPSWDGSATALEVIFNDSMLLPEAN